MKQGWEIKKLGEVVDILDNLRKPITKRDRVEGEYPYYGATGILSYVHNYIFSEKLVLIGEDGAKWASGDNTSFIAEGKYWVNNHAHVIRPNRKIILDEWIVYFLNFSDLTPFITGMTVPKLNQEKMRSIPIPLPPLPEQQRIVSLLDEAFAVIERSRNAAIKNLKNAKELFESYLQGVFEKKGDGWEETHLSKVCDFENGDRGKNYPNKSHRVSSGIPFINAGHLNENRLDFSDMDYISEERFNMLGNGKIKPNDILFCLRGSLGKVANVGNLNKGAIASSLVILRVKNELDNDFLLYFLNSNLTKKQIVDFGNGAAQPNLSAASLKKFIIPFPKSKEAQHTIVRQLDALRAETQKLEAVYQKKIADLEELKKSILQKAFAGELKTEKALAI